MNYVFIMRGIPGSGKSTLAGHLAGAIGRIHSTDSYFEGPDGYRFIPEKLRDHHLKNYEAFCRSLEERIPIVICDNTNSRHWEYGKYSEAAEKHGYQVVVVTLPHPPVDVAASRNKHGVPRRKIEEMISRWES